MKVFTGAYGYWNTAPAVDVFRITGTLKLFELSQYCVNFKSNFFFFFIFKSLTLSNELNCVFLFLYYFKSVDACFSSNMCFKEGSFSVWITGGETKHKTKQRNVSHKEHLHKPNAHLLTPAHLMEPGAPQGAVQRHPSSARSVFQAPGSLGNS